MTSNQKRQTILYIAIYSAKSDVKRVSKGEFFEILNHSKSNIKRSAARRKQATSTQRPSLQWIGYEPANRLLLT